MASAATKQAYQAFNKAPRKPSVRSLYDAPKASPPILVPTSCRTLPEVMIGHDSTVAGRFIRHPFKAFYGGVVMPRMQEHFLVRAVNHYATDWEAPFVNHVYETEVTSVQLNFVYLHLWLLKFHLGRPLKDKIEVNKEIKGEKLLQPRVKVNPKNIRTLIDRLIKHEHVNVFTNTFDESIHEELKRQYRVIDHSLSAVFQHSPRALDQERRTVTRLDDDDLEELILYNILNEEPEAKREQIKRISDYIRISVHEEDTFSFVTRMEDSYFQANEANLFKEHSEKLRRESLFRQTKAEQQV